MGRTDTFVASESSDIDLSPWTAEQLASFASHPGTGRILNIRSGDPKDNELETCLRTAGYCLGRLPVTRDPSHLPSAAATFAPDVVYISLIDPIEPAIRALEVLASDPKTRNLPLVGLLPPGTDPTLIEAAYSRSGCDFLRTNVTQIEVLARTHLLVRLANRVASSPLHERPMADAANDPAGARLDLRDPTTGSYTATYLRHRLRSETARAIRYQRPLSLAAVRCSAALASEDDARLLGRALLDSCRGVDLVARVEMDLFVLVLPETDATGAMTVQARIQQALASSSLGFSIGLATLGEDLGNPAFDAESLLHQAVIHCSP